MIRKDLGRGLYNEVNALIKESLEHSFTNYPAITEYVKEHAQAMSETVMRKHIDLYVNDYSLDLGADGSKAVETLSGVYQKIAAASEA